MTPKSPRTRAASPVLHVYACLILSLLASTLALPTRAGGVREAAPEDGIVCCLGVEPFLFHSDEVLAITGRPGVFKSKSRGARWDRSMEGLVAPNGISPYIDSRCQAPSDPRIVYVLAGLNNAVSPFNGLFSSDDFGDTWTRRGLTNTGFGFNLCIVDATDPRTLYIAGFDSSTFTETIWKSTDGGQTVQVFSTNLPACAVGFVFPRRGALFVIASCAVVSNDGGATFQPVPLPPGLKTAEDVSPDGNTIFVSTSLGTFRSTDRGASYVPVSGLPNGFDGFLLGFDPTNPSRIYANDGLLHVSTDGGLSFALLPASNDPRFLGPIREMSVDPRGSLYISTLAGPFRSDDGGLTFRSLLNGFRASNVQDLAFDADGNLLVGVRNTQVIFRQTHGRPTSSSTVSATTASR